MLVIPSTLMQYFELPELPSTPEDVFVAQVARCLQCEEYVISDARPHNGYCPVHNTMMFWLGNIYCRDNEHHRRPNPYIDLEARS